jgi:hypothetical protein
MTCPALKLTEADLMDERESLVGEIMNGRYAIVEHLAGDTYEAFDMQAMRKMKILIKPGGGFVVWEAVKPPPTPPPIPPPVPRPASSSQDGPKLTRFEAAWFARGEQLEHEEEGAENISDYAAYQFLLEQLALQMP